VGGSAFVGFVAMIPVVVGFQVASRGFSDWTGRDVIIALVTALILGGLGGFASKVSDRG